MPTQLDQKHRAEFTIHVREAGYSAAAQKLIIEILWGDVRPRTAVEEAWVTQAVNSFNAKLAARAPLIGAVVTAKQQQDDADAKVLAEFESIEMTEWETGEFSRWLDDGSGLTALAANAIRRCILDDRRIASQAENVIKEVKRFRARPKPDTVSVTRDQSVGDLSRYAKELDDAANIIGERTGFKLIKGIGRLEVAESLRMLYPERGYCHRQLLGELQNPGYGFGKDVAIHVLWGFPVEIVVVIAGIQEGVVEHIQESGFWTHSKSDANFVTARLAIDDLIAAVRNKPEPLPVHLIWPTGKVSVCGIDSANLTGPGKTFDVTRVTCPDCKLFFNNSYITTVKTTTEAA